jgi:DNA-binding XRE family transcriptional regulator
MTTHSNSESPFELAISDEDPQAQSENSGHSGTFCDTAGTFGLTDVQFRAIELTIQGQRDIQIAQTLGLNRKTIWRWKTENENYRQALTLAREYLHSTTTDRCQTIAQKATIVLAGFLEPGIESKDRMKAAQILLNVATRFKPVPEKRQQQPMDIDNYLAAPIPEPKVG